MVLPDYTKEDCAPADHGAKLKPGHRLATRLCVVRDDDRLKTRPIRGGKVRLVAFGSSDGPSHTAKQQLVNLNGWHRA